MHDKKLPGKPDLVFRSREKIISVNGCFWHQHQGCRDGKTPKSNTGYWKPKLEKNVMNDKTNRQLLSELGWSVLTIWECETADIKALTDKITVFLEN